ncbi:unnamed protein product [Ectocarpus fasciculatus]
MPLDQWADLFREEVLGVASMDAHTVGYQESAERLRAIVRSGLLLHTDLADKPERFFLAHRLLAEHTPKLGPGFWIRFTVHYNLCMGTVLALGSEEQVASLKGMQDRGELGCFSLTERFAGVNSGMIVETAAEWDEHTGEFVLNSSSEGSQKNWISQGLVADKTVVLADLRVKGKRMGPHAFLMDMRADGRVVPGVRLGDMGTKTVGNDLDNAWIAFDGVRLPKSALLNRYADIDPATGEYQQKVKGLPAFHMIGQRLFSGRVAVAQAALTFRRELFRSTAAYTDAKRCWAPGGESTLSDIPQLRALYEEANENDRLLQSFVHACELDLSASLRAGTAPSLGLVEAIAVAKVRAVEDSIALTHSLRNEVGSYALMKDSGFGQTDFLQCCKFAEGDSRILMQKMARDRMAAHAKKGAAAEGGPVELQRCEELTASLAGHVEAGRAADKHAAWDLCWRDVYGLADAVMTRTMKNYLETRV